MFTYVLDPTLSCNKRTKLHLRPFSSASLFRTLGYPAHQHTSRYLYFPSQQMIPLNLISPFSITSFASLLQQQTSNCLGEVKVTQSYPTLFDPMDYTVHGILQARIPEWVAFPFSRRSSQPRDQTQVSRIASRFFTSWATREALSNFTSNTLSHITVMVLLLVFHWNWSYRGLPGGIHDAKPDSQFLVLSLLG